MEALDQLTWAGEHDYDMAGFRFVLRSTSEQFLTRATEVLDPYRTQASEPVWPVLSVVAPVNSPARRGFYLGYVNAQELFRYPDEESALGALLAGIDTVGRAQLSESYAVLDAAAIRVGGHVMLVYGSEIDQWLAKVAGSGLNMLERPAMLDPSTNTLVSWPLEVTDCPTALDRRGVRLAPLAQLVERIALGPLAVTAVVRASAGEAATPGQVVGELMESRVATGRRKWVFRAVAQVVAHASLVQDKDALHRLVDKGACKGIPSARCQPTKGSV